MNAQTAAQLHADGIAALGQAQIRRASELFGQAVARDSQFAPALAALAETQLRLGIQNAEGRALSRRLVERALARDPRLARAHSALGWLDFFEHQSYTNARSAFERALALDSTLVFARFGYGLLLASQGEFERALVETERAERAGVTPPNWRVSSAVVLFFARRYSDAAARAAQPLNAALAPDYFWLGNALLAAGAADSAVAALRSRVQESNLPGSIASLAAALAVAGRDEEARRLRARLDSMWQAAPRTSEQPEPCAALPCHQFAVAYLAAGEREAALRWLEKSLLFQGVVPWGTWLAVDPRLDPLRGDARFRRVLERAGHAARLDAQQASPAASFLSDSLHSAKLNVTVRLKIGLPLEFGSAESADERYPVLIMPGARDDLAFGATLTSLRLLNAPFGHAVPPLIMVGVASDAASPYARSGVRIDSLRPNAGGADAYAEFLARELIPYIRSRYPTSDYAVVAGHSRYGVLSIYSLSLYPDVFDAAVAVSTAFWELSDEANDRALMDRVVQKLRPGRSRIYLGVGEYDSLPIRRAAAEFAQRLQRALAPDRFRNEQLAGDTHQTTRQSGFVRGIRWLFEPVSLAANPVYALMGGYERDLDTLALRNAYAATRSRYAEGAKALGFPEQLPSRYLATIISLPPIDHPSKPIPIYRLICADFAVWYPTKELPRACRGTRN